MDGGDTMKDVFDHLSEGAKHAFDLLSIASLLGFLTSRSRSGPTLRAGEVGCVAGR